MCHFKKYLTKVLYFSYSLPGNLLGFIEEKHVLHCMRSNLNMSSFNEAILFSGDSILIKEGCEIKKYKERDFSQKSSLLTPTIIR